MPNFKGFDLLNDDIVASLKKRAPAYGRFETFLPGIAVSRYDEPTTPARCLHSPMIAYVAQGVKRSFFGETEANYGAGQCVVLGMDMPGVCQIVEADAARPFLSLSIRIDNRLIANLYGEMSLDPLPSSPPAPIVGVCEAHFELLDAFRRLAALLYHPAEAATLAPLVLKEIHFHILAGSLGSCLRLFNEAGSKSVQIRKAISWLRENYKSELNVPQLAEKANMAASTFYRSFRRATGFSPLQFQKRLRLHEAERLMLAENYDASSAACAVGYESGSQFTKEYKRLFGAPPHQDIASRFSRNN